MGDCPPAKKLRTGKWDFNEQREWLLDRIINVVIPEVNEAAKFDEPEPEYAESYGIAGADSDSRSEPVTLQGIAKAATAANDAAKRAHKATSALVEPEMPPFDPENDMPEEIPF